MVEGCGRVDGVLRMVFWLVLTCVYFMFENVVSGFEGCVCCLFVDFE